MLIYLGKNMANYQKNGILFMLTNTISKHSNKTNMKTAQEIMKEHHLVKEEYQSQGGSYFTVENIESAMEEYASQSKWIDVKERLPEFGVSVLILSIPRQPRMENSLDYGIARRTDIRGTSLEKDNRTIELLENNHQFMRNETVVFWQPLPESPKQD